MHATDPRVELIPATFSAPGAECFDLYFTGVGGARIHAKYLRQTGTSKPHPAVVEFHGYTGSSGDWLGKLGYIDIQNITKRIKGKVLMGCGLIDNLMNPVTFE